MVIGTHATAKHTKSTADATETSLRHLTAIAQRSRHAQLQRQHEKAASTQEHIASTLEHIATTLERILLQLLNDH